MCYHGAESGEGRQVRLVLRLPRRPHHRIVIVPQGCFLVNLYPPGPVYPLWTRHLSPNPLSRGPSLTCWDRRPSKVRRRIAITTNGSNRIGRGGSVQIHQILRIGGGE
jgi:hypothetical protein